MPVTDHEAIDSPSFQVADRADGVEVRGYTRSEVIAALQFFAKVRLVQAEQVGATREDLVHALMVKGVSLTPPASLRQAQRLASLRDALLSTPVYTYKSLAEIRGERESSTRTWVSRKRNDHCVFSVPHDGRALIPAFQFTELGSLRDELADVLRPMLDAGVDGWTLWHWMTSPTSLLSGEIPEKTARTAPERVVLAAQRFAMRPSA